MFRFSSRINFVSFLFSAPLSAQINFQPRVVGISSTLHLAASNETAGRYYCKAHSIGFPEISAEALVILKGSPRILSPSEQYPVGADVYEIECLAISVPKAKHVSWAFNGVLIDLDKDVDFSLRQTVTHDTIKSTLRIEENHLKYFGVYSCTVINKYGSDTLDISYMQRSKRSPRLSPGSSQCAKHTTATESQPINYYTCPIDVHFIRRTMHERAEIARQIVRRMKLSQATYGEGRASTYWLYPIFVFLCLHREIIISSNCFRLGLNFAHNYCRMSEYVLLYAQQEAATATSRHYTEGESSNSSLPSPFNGKWKQPIVIFARRRVPGESTEIENEFAEKERNAKDGRGNRYTDDTNRRTRVPGE